MFCSLKCANQYRKENSEKRVTYEQLKNDLKTMSYCSIGRKYGVSDNAVRKWCISYGLPRTVSEKKEFFKID